ncbi:MAG: MlaD family protein [Solirubrobacteraceae bacterium]|nr:MlaD family protein [Solirubrobacteraceae bacterium]
MKIEHRLGKMLMIALFTAVCLLIFAWLFGKAGGTLPGGPERIRAQALVPTAFQLVPNADVRRAGVTIGKVASVDNRGSLGLVSFDVDAHQGPIYRNATVRIRTKTVVGENYIDIDPGDRRAGKLPEGGTLPVTQAGEAVQLDEVLSGLDAPTRAEVQRNLSAIGGGLEDRGPQLNRLFGELPKVFDRVTALDDVLRHQRPQLARLVDQTGDVMQAFANRTADVRSLAIHGEATAAAAASRDERIKSAFAELPATLRQVRRTTTRLGEVARGNTAVVADLASAMTSISPVTRRLERSARAGRRIVEILPSLSERADPMLHRLTRFAPEAAKIVPPADELLRQANPLLTYLKPYSRELGTMFANLGSAADTTDATGHLGRIMVMVGSRTVNGLPKEVYDALDFLLGVGGHCGSAGDELQRLSGSRDAPTARSARESASLDRCGSHRDRIVVAMSVEGGSSPLAYARVTIDRPIPVGAGHYVIGVEPPGESDRLTGITRTEASTDVLVVEHERAPGIGCAATLIRASEPLTSTEVERQLRAWRDEGVQAERWVGALLATINQAVRALRLTHRDPYAIEVTIDDLDAAVVGCAEGRVLTAGGSGDEVDVLRGKKRRRRSITQRARPGEIVARALAGTLPMREGEELISFAVREANHGRLRSAAAAIEASRRLLAEVIDLPGDTWSAPGLEADTVLAACEAVQERLDRWREGDATLQARPVAGGAGRGARPVPSTGTPTSHAGTKDVVEQNNGTQCYR